MKLYFSPGACSLAVRIAMIEAGMAFSAVHVDMRTKALEDGSDFHSINPQGTVPVLALDNGEYLTEVAAILQYVADAAPNTGLAPKNGTFARVRLQEALNFIATEIHKSWSPCFSPAFDDSIKAVFAERLKAKYAVIDARLAKQSWVSGDTFGIADAYLFVTLLWRHFLAIDLPGLSALEAFMERTSARPSVKQALAQEGLG